MGFLNCSLSKIFFKIQNFRENKTRDFEKDISTKLTGRRPHDLSSIMWNLSAISCKEFTNFYYF